MGIRHPLSYNIRIKNVRNYYFRCFLRFKNVSEVNLYETETNSLPILWQYSNFKRCLSHVYELGSSLCKLLSTLKKNREQVPLHILKTQYKVPYEALIRQINETATAFVKEVVFSKLLMNPDEEKEEQYSVIQEIVNTSGMLKEMNHSLSQTYDVELLHRQALKLRECIEDALYPYIARKDCLVVDMEHIEDTPIIYNTITRKVYENDQWVDRKLDLQGKFLLFIKPDNGSPQQSEKEMLQNESKPIPSLHIPSEYDTKTQGSHL